MSAMGIVTSLIAGGVGGNMASSVLKKFDLGPVGNTIAGLIGGFGGGQLLGMLLSGGTVAAVTSPAGTDLSSMLANVGGAGVGGALLTAIFGMVKTQMSKGTTSR